MFKWKQAQVAIPFTLLGFGIFFTGKSAYYYSKGFAAKVFIEDAWEKTKESEKNIPPWSWADFYPVAQIKVESIQLDCIVLNQVSDEALTFGPGHLSNTSLPGQPGNMVIAGHRDGHFRKLANIKKQDIVELESVKESTYYIVTEITPTFGQDIYWTENTSKNVLTLITCFPFDFIGKAEERFIVRCEKINPDT